MKLRSNENNGSQPMAILLGGLANTVSVARALGKKGVAVTVIAKKRCAALKSKYVNPIEVPENISLRDFCHDLFINNTRFPSGSVIFPCDDRAIEFVATNKHHLRQRYLLDIQDSDHQLYLLDKQKTLALAREIGIGTPKSWNIDYLQDVEAISAQVQFPVLIKPIHSHVFQSHFNKKLFYIENETQLISLSKIVLESNIKFMICEFIPGPDNLLSSYYVYIDKDNNRLFEFTKRVLRRSPPNFGVGSYHITEWLQETADKGFQFFSGIGFQGLGNIEFKLDLRDGELKVIECNARFTGAQELITQSGINMPFIIYRYLTLNEKIYHDGFKEFMSLWLPFDDFDACRVLLSTNQLTFTKWLKSISRKQVFSYFDKDDMKPFIAETKYELGRRIKWIMTFKE